MQDKKEGDLVKLHLNTQPNMKIPLKLSSTKIENVYDFQLLDTFVTSPDLNPSGVTVIIKMKYNQSVANTTTERFIFDSGGWLGHGISLFVHQNSIFAVVGSRGQVWVVCKLFARGLQIFTLKVLMYRVY